MFALLAVKAGAWSGRRSAKDALDIWRLLEIAREQGLQPKAWVGGGGGSAGHARDVLIRDAAAIAQAATPTTRSQARVRALIAAHVGADD